MPVSGEVGSRFAGPVANLLAEKELDLLASAAQVLQGDRTRAEWEAQALARIRLWRMRADASVAGALEELVVAVRSALAQASAEGAAQSTADRFIFRYDDFGGGEGRVVVWWSDIEDRTNFNTTGLITWNAEGKVSWVGTNNDEDRRKGVATALWNEAKLHRPDIRHSEEQSESGRAWAKAADSGTVKDRDVQREADRLAAQLASTLRQAPRLVENILREAVRAGVDEVRSGLITRRNASQQVLNRLNQEGITGFRDKAGRNWSLTSYAEMAVRTETQARALAAGDASIRALGLTQVVVSDSPRECDICRPFEGKVLNLDGTGPGTLADARAKGFQHPNCTHSYSAYIPGTSKLTPAKSNPEGYEAKQRQRALERQVRAAKRAEVLALDPTTKAAARARVRDRQAQLRQHVADKGLKRLPGRESIKTAV